LLVRRSAFEAAGGFDENFFLFFEDIDFCLRLRRGGGRVVYDPAITILHHRGASAAQVPAKAKLAYRRSQLYFWGKHRPAWESALLRFYLRTKGELPPAEAGE
jgi:GT2 family glycosyltransferase